MCIKTPFWCRWISWIHNSETSCLECARAVEGKWENLRDCDTKKEVHFLGLFTLRGTQDYWLELLHELLNYIIVEYCDVIFCICIHVHMHGDVH
jgi:hypothetical protein